MIFKESSSSLSIYMDKKESIVHTVKYSHNSFRNATLFPVACILSNGESSSDKQKCCIYCKRRQVTSVLHFVLFLLSFNLFWFFMHNHRFQQCYDLLKQSFARCVHMCDIQLIQLVFRFISNVGTLSEFVRTCTLREALVCVAFSDDDCSQQLRSNRRKRRVYQDRNIKGGKQWTNVDECR